MSVATICVRAQDTSTSQWIKHYTNCFRVKGTSFVCIGLSNFNLDSFCAALVPDPNWLTDSHMQSISSRYHPVVVFCTQDTYLQTREILYRHYNRVSTSGDGCSFVRPFPMFASLKHLPVYACDKQCKQNTVSRVHPSYGSV